MFCPILMLTIFLCWNSAASFTPAIQKTPTRTDPRRMSEMLERPEIKMMSLDTKMVGVMSIKTAEDVVDSPPKKLDDNFPKKPEGNKLPRTRPLSMLFKLIGVLVFKTAHDAVHYPIVWTKRMVKGRSKDESKRD
mmetsp:Transcript_35991/g.41059  ORF Transcript_35991/g.41059 Transcript_35991/m.41059 type:complete len:135 (-) Transcript_35991:141-545(-)